jgi:hypothetical protein
MSRFPDWVGDAVTPTDDELDRLASPVPEGLVADCADATSPSEVELGRLLRRLRTPAPRRAPLAAMLRPVPMAAALLVVAATAFALATRDPAPDGLDEVVPAPVESEEAPEPEVEPTVVAAEPEPTALRTTDEAPAEPARRRPERTPTAAPRSPAIEPTTTPAVREQERVAVLDPRQPDETTEPSDPADVRAFRRVVEESEMNAPQSTLILSERFLQKHPESELAEEVRIIRLEAMAQVGEPREALAALDGWLATRPEHPQFLSLLELRADVARDGLRDPRSALAGYRVLASRGRGEQKARGQAFRGLCAWSLGLEDEAYDSLSEAQSNHFLPEDLRFEVTEALAALEASRRVVPMRKAQ